MTETFQKRSDVKIPSENHFKKKDIQDTLKFLGQKLIDLFF